MESFPSFYQTYSYAGLYILSGCSQPLIMTLCKNAGLANPKAQLYMVFYYIGPSFVMLKLLLSHDVVWPTSKMVIVQASCIALWDICSTSMNYTGASMAGPTIFAIVYSSVTIWTAILSRIFLHRTMNIWQWIGVLTVFGGLTITASDAASSNVENKNNDVIYGFLLVLVGSAMHALTYVMSERIMTNKISGEEMLSIHQNCAIQSLVACICLVIWQFIYTIPNFDKLIRIPVQEAETSILYAMSILLSFAVANLIHSIAFFHTLKYFVGGSTSAGVMKGLQAVLVFVFTHFVYCGRTGGNEMCLSKSKLLSLVTVIGGGIFYVISTTQKNKKYQQQQQQYYYNDGGGEVDDSSQQQQKRYGYEEIQDHDDDNVLGEVEIEPI